ncbi:glycosyltransferase [Lithospermum erythrorhizon]|uniref:Glycosyltransferase n=1 Tax=Lithospermum erythrorhizon TaxID=34254 RepID=A0AAV3QP54_LITER
MKHGKIKLCSLTGMMFLTLGMILLVIQIILTSIGKQHSEHATITHWTQGQEKTWLLKHHSNSEPPTQLIKCDRSHKFYDTCSINRPVVFETTNSTFILMESRNEGKRTNIVIENVKPYPRKWEKQVMSTIQEVTLVAGSSSPPCLVHHDAPALVFSAGGYTGNFFHEFNDGLIPLFITFKTMFQGNQEFILVISELQQWWVSKYEDLLSSFSKYPIIDFEKEKMSHCFPSVSVGLISHGLMTITPKLMPNSETIRDFRVLLESTYGRNVTYIPKPRVNRPRLVLISRGGHDGRAILNEEELKIVANRTGFKTILFRPTTNASLQQSYELINSSHAMVGVHGAALTHFLYLRPGAVFIQIVPIGPEDVADKYFGKPARELGLEYMEYKIGVKESSLIDRYSKRHLVQGAIARNAWSKEFKSVYMREQNVRIDLVRVREYLKQAYRKAKRLMRTNG